MRCPGRLTTAVAWTALVAFVFLWLAPGFDYFALSGELDHGYQVALGQQAFNGSVPGIDFFTQYGPAIAWISAVSWGTGHPWLAEVISWCVFLAMGYGLLWWWCSDDQLWYRRILVLWPALLFTPFYAKYYFVFFPALFLVALADGVTADGGGWRPAGAGFVAGTAGLFRIELGLALAFAGAVFLGWDDVKARRWPRNALLHLGVFGIVAAGYLVYLAAVAGNWSASWWVIDFQWAAIQGKIQAFSRNEVSLHGLFQRGAAGFWALVALTVFYLGLAYLGARTRWRARYPRRIWAAALVGCCLLPQVTHNTGVTYALQIGLPACGIVAVLALAWWETDRRWALILFGIYLVAGVVLRLGTPNYGYDGFRESLREKFESLATETIRTPPNPDALRLLDIVKSRVPPGGRMLVPSLDSGLYALSHRCWAGYLPHLGIPLSSRWQQRCVEELRRHPPALIVTPDPLTEAMLPFGYLGQNPVIESYLQRNFVVVDRSIPGWRLLGPRPSR